MRGCETVGSLGDSPEIEHTITKFADETISQRVLRENNELLERYEKITLEIKAYQKTGEFGDLRQSISHIEKYVPELKERKKYLEGILEADPYHKISYPHNWKHFGAFMSHASSEYNSLVITIGMIKKDTARR